MHGLSTLTKLNQRCSDRYTKEEIAEGALRSAAAQPIDKSKIEEKPGEDPGTI